MPAQDIANEVKELLEPLAASQDATVQEVTLKQTSMGQVLGVTVDDKVGLENLNSEQVANLAREFSRALDKHDPIAGRYTLEVSSPGAESELTNDRQYRRAVGRTVKVLLRTDKKVEGKLTDVTDDGFTLATADGERTINFDDVRKAHPVAEAPEEK